jgi:hypothetical protein
MIIQTGLMQQRRLQIARIGGEAMRIQTLKLIENGTPIDFVDCKAGSHNFFNSSIFAPSLRVQAHQSKHSFLSKASIKFMEIRTASVVLL